MPISRQVSRLVRRARSNFFWAFVFLDRDRRDAIFSAYAFARHTDDLVDEADSVDDARSGLTTWRNELAACYAGRPSTPITMALHDMLERFPIPAQHFEALIDGVEMDLTHRRYESFETLYAYCYRVAAAVGLICIEIFGYRNPRTRDYAERLGIALQLTNILRDIAEDATRDRIYIPADELNRFGCSESGILQSRHDDAFTDLMAFQVARAKRYYQGAAASLAPEDTKAMFAAETMGSIYRGILDRIEGRNYRVLEGRVTIPTATKVGIAVKNYARSRWGP